MDNDFRVRADHDLLLVCVDVEVLGACVVVCCAVVVALVVVVVVDVVYPATGTPPRNIYKTQ